MPISKNKRFTQKEVALATGLSPTVVKNRCEKLGLKGDRYHNQQGLSYEEVQMICTYQRRRMRKGTNENAEELRAALLNDGFAARKEPIK